MGLIRHSLLFILVIFPFNKLLCQEWRVYNETNSNLFHDYVRDIVVDSNGIVWVGASGYLFSFDGLNWASYSINVTNSNPNISTVLDMCLLNDNNILIGTTYGLCIFNTLTKYADMSLNSTIPFDWIESVGQTDDGTMWIGEGVTNGRAASYSNNNWTTYQAFSSSDDVYCIANKNNETWLASGSIKKYENGNFTQYYYGNSPLTQGALIQAMAFDANGNLWVDAPSQAVPPIYRLLKFDGINWFEYDTLNCVQDGSNISNILPLDSSVWFTLDYEGLVHYNYYTNGCSFYDEYNSVITGNNFGGLCTDNNENIFIGTDNGLIVYNKNKIILDAYKYSDLSVYPNPFTGLLTFRFFSQSDQDIEFSLHNEIGEIVLHEKRQVKSGKIDLPVSIPDLSRGIYFASIIFNNSLVTKKLLKVD